jgi:hypothetical protein
MGIAIAPLRVHSRVAVLSSLQTIMPRNLMIRPINPSSTAVPVGLEPSQSYTQRKAGRQ